MQPSKPTNQPAEAVHPADDLAPGPEALWLEFTILNPGLAENHPLRLATFSIRLLPTTYFHAEGYFECPDAYEVDEATVDRSKCWLLGHVSKQDPFLMRMALTDRGDFSRVIFAMREADTGSNCCATNSMVLQKSSVPHLEFGKDLIHIVCEEYDLNEDGEIPSDGIKTRLFCPMLVKLYPSFFQNKTVLAIIDRAFDLRRGRLFQLDQLDELKRSYRDMTADLNAREEGVQKVKRQRLLVGEEKAALEAELDAVKGGLFAAFDD